MKRIVNYSDFSLMIKTEPSSILEGFFSERKNELKKEISRFNQLIGIESDSQRKQILMFDRDIKKYSLTILEIKEKKEILKNSMGS
jgi:hypothetical protein